MPLACVEKLYLMAVKFVDKTLCWIKYLCYSLIWLKKHEFNSTLYLLVKVYCKRLTFSRKSFIKWSFMSHLQARSRSIALKGQKWRKRCQVGTISVQRKCRRMVQRKRVYQDHLPYSSRYKMEFGNQIMG